MSGSFVLISFIIVALCVVGVVLISACVYSERPQLSGVYVLSAWVFGCCVCVFFWYGVYVLTRGYL